MLQVMYSFCNTFEELSGFIVPWQLEDEHEPGPITMGVAEEGAVWIATIAVAIKRCL